MKVCIDPGHAPGCVNGGYGYLEYAGMWKLSTFLKSALERCKADVTLTRAEGNDPSLTSRGYAARGHDLFISEHSNAANGTARGVEAYYSVQVAGDKKLAAALSLSVSSAMGSTDRGAKTRQSTDNPNYDYYSVMYSAREMSCPHVILIENGFHDNQQDVEYLKKDENLKNLAEVQCKEICKFFGLTYISEQPDMMILLAPAATGAQAEAWARSKGATETFISLAKKYFDISSTCGGVNPLLAFVQAALETSYGKFGGVIDESYCNPCGMKTASGGSDIDKNAHQRFKNWDEGVTAHLEHLALYAGAAGFPRQNAVDPRHFAYLAGTGKTIDAMSKGWCPTNSDYSNILKRMIKEIEEIPAQQTNINIRGKQLYMPMKNIDSTNYVAVKDLTEIMPDLIISVRQSFEASGYKVGWDDASKTIIIT